MNAANRFKKSALALALAANASVVVADDFDPELLYPGVEEEEEEEEEDDGLEEDEEEDRGDEVDPDLPPDVDDENDDPLEEQEEEQEELDPDALAELAGDSKSKMVPHARFNEVNESLKTERATRLRLEEELARAKGKAPADKGDDGEEEVKPFDFDAAEERYMDALIDGEKDKAKQIRAEIRSQEKAYYTAEATKGAKETVEQERARSNAETQQAAMVGVLEKAVTKYPFLNHESEEANSDAIDEVVALRNHFFNKGGVTLAQALEKAVAKVGPRYAEVDADEEEKPAAGKKSATKAQIERNLERDKQQPARMPGIGERNSKIDFANLSEEEFSNLSAADKKKARGDYVA